MAEFKELITESSSKFEATISKYKGVLEKQIIVKITSTYMQRAEEKQIITSCKNLVELLNLAQEGTYKE